MIVVLIAAGTPLMGRRKISSTMLCGGDVHYPDDQTLQTTVFDDSQEDSSMQKYIHFRMVF